MQNHDPRAQVEAARGPRLWELAAGAGLVLLFGWPLAFTNLILARGDTFLYFYPLWDYRARALLDGRLPLWTPELFMGAPFLANSQTGVLYPFNWPLAFFSAPQAVKFAIALHLLIAFAGAQTFARRSLGQSAWAGLLAGGLFALGGYVLAQVEHVNQLQALAWFPWLLLAAEVRRRAWKVAALSGVIALQFLAGHTQSVFISLTGFGLYQAVTLAPAAPSSWPRFLVSGLLSLGPVLALALGLAAAQLLPTLELARESLRSGGLPWREALSFSLDPRLLGRALLPGYSRSLFSEFVASSSVAGLALTALGWRRSRPAVALAVLALTGLTFALGGFNPLYAALAALPPFNLFRVPARWLFLFAFGAALLAGFGLDRLRPEGRGLWAGGRRPRLWLLAVLWPVALLGLAPLATGLTPPGETGPLGAPAISDWVGWLAPLAALAILCVIPGRGRAGLSPAPTRPFGKTIVPGAAALVMLELFCASRTLPLNTLTAPEAYASMRPAMTQLLVDRSAPAPDRFLSMSALRFDPGDLAELRGLLEPQLPPAAVDEFIVATKHKEVLSPNLPLAWGAPAVDGFDGGVLPLRTYAAFTALLTGRPSADGRLRENLQTVPDLRLLALVNARWLITDKVGDAWLDGVFYDLQFTLDLAEGERSRIARAPAFEATAVGVVAEGADGRLRLTDAGGVTIELPLSDGRVSLGRPFTPAQIELIGPARVRGLSLIDTRTGAFQSLTLGPFRLAHSGDVKVYEHLEALPRAFVASQAVWVEDAAAARAALTDPAWEPAEVVVLDAADRLRSEGGAAGDGGDARLEVYEPEHLRLTATGPGYLVLTDAFYPGWSATVDGRAAPILRANLMFRAVPLPAGPHAVEFRFAPDSVTTGLALSGISLLALLGLLLTPQIVPLLAANRRRAPPATGLRPRSARTETDDHENIV